MNRRPRVIAVALALVNGVLLIAALSCSGAKLSEMWRDPSFDSGPAKKIMVLAVMRKEANRRLWEDSFVAALGKESAAVTPSYQLFSRGLPDTSEVDDAVRDGRFDAVIEIHPLRPDTTLHYVPGYVTSEPVTRYNRWSMAYRTYYRDVYHPGYVESDRHVRNQIEVWSTGDTERLVWTGASDVVDPKSSDEVRKKVAGKVVDELEKQGIIPKG